MPSVSTSSAVAVNPRLCASMRMAKRMSWSMVLMPNAKCQMPKAKCRRPNAEGQRSKGRRSKPDFRSKVAISRKECCEARYWLRLLNHANPRLQPLALPLISESSELIAILTAIKMNSEQNDSHGERKDGQADEDR